MLGRTRAAFFGLALTLAPLLAMAGCLGRTGLVLDDTEEIPGQDTGVVDDGSVLPDGAVIDDSAVPVDTGTRPDARRDSAPDGWIDIFDAIPFPIPDSGPIGACATCVADKCRGQVNSCVNDPACLQGLGCVVQKCLAGGTGFDMACLAGCFNGDFTAMLTAVNAFSCVTGTCGSACGGLLGGIPGLPGSGGSGGSGGGATPGGFLPLRASSVEELRSMDPTLRLSVSPDAFDAWRAPLQRSACAQGLATCGP
jgi:hypothetical protein